MSLRPAAPFARVERVITLVYLDQGASGERRDTLLRLARACVDGGLGLRVFAPLATEGATLPAAWTPIERAATRASLPFEWRPGLTPGQEAQRSPLGTAVRTSVNTLVVAGS
jgi:hypothetical protein